MSLVYTSTFVFIITHTERERDDLPATYKEAKVANIESKRVEIRDRKTIPESRLLDPLLCISSIRLRRMNINHIIYNRSWIKVILVQKSRRSEIRVSNLNRNRVASYSVVTIDQWGMKYCIYTIESRLNTIHSRVVGFSARAILKIHIWAWACVIAARPFIWIVGLELHNRKQ